MPVPARHDEHGLLPDHCWQSYLDGRIYGFVEGVTDGRRQVEDELWQVAVEVASNVAQSITTNTVTGLALRGSDEELRAAAEQSRTRSVEAFRADHARRRAGLIS